MPWFPWRVCIISSPTASTLPLCAIVVDTLCQRLAETCVSVYVSWLYVCVCVCVCVEAPGPATGSDLCKEDDQQEGKNV